jgi:hypothetical protein
MGLFLDYKISIEDLWLPPGKQKNHQIIHMKTMIKFRKY